jgi:hypothetical protein
VALGLVGTLADQPFEGGTLTRLDTPQGLQGLRVVWPEALCVARAATSMPGLSLRFEGANPAALRLAQEQFKGAFSVVRPGVALPF